MKKFTKELITFYFRLQSIFKSSLKTKKIAMKNHSIPKPSRRTSNSLIYSGISSILISRFYSLIVGRRMNPLQTKRIVLVKILKSSKRNLFMLLSYTRNFKNRRMKSSLNITLQTICSFSRMKQNKQLDKTMNQYNQRQYLFF